MPYRIYRVPEARSELAVSALLGLVVALALFIVMAVAQMIGNVKAPEKEIAETLVAYTPPEIEQLQQEEAPPEQDEEPPPEDLAQETPQLSLDQLDIALNPGTGGTLAGDFALPTIQTSQRDLGTEDFVDFSELDQMPRPIGVTGIDFPARLRKKKVNGTIVLLVKLDATGKVLDVKVDSSDLPDFDQVVRDAVASWKFTPPTLQGRPVKAQARLPMPIRIK